jgi:hypothetical protein
MLMEIVGEFVQWLGITIVFLLIVVLYIRSL